MFEHGFAIPEDFDVTTNLVRNFLSIIIQCKGDKQIIQFSRDR